MAAILAVVITAVLGAEWGEEIVEPKSLRGLRVAARSGLGNAYCDPDGMADWKGSPTLDWG